MTEVYHQQAQGQLMQHHQQFLSNTRVVKAATAAAVGLSLLVLAGLTFVGTVIALMVATPLLVIFSPVLVPAVIALFLVATGFLTSGVFGIAAATVLAWMYKYAVAGETPRGAESMEQAMKKLGSKGNWDTAGGEHYLTEEARNYRRS